MNLYDISNINADTINLKKDKNDNKISKNEETIGKKSEKDTILKHNESSIRSYPPFFYPAKI